jgi:hypothetical protein
MLYLRYKSDTCDVSLTLPPYLARLRVRVGVAPVLFFALAMVIVRDNI